MQGWKMALAPLLLALLSLALLGGCSEIAVGRCSTDEECGGDGVCDAGLCLRDPAPRLVVALDRTAARVGEVVEVDASASSIPGGGPLSFWFSVEPGDAAVIESLPETPGRARMRMVMPHVDATVVVRAESGTGRITEQRRVVQAANSVPTLSLRLVEDAFEPGEPATVEALVGDGDDDELSIAWSLEGEKGRLEVAGATAVLTSVSDYTGIYRVHGSVRDGWGGIAEAVLDVSPSNRAPRLTIHPVPPAAHACEGERGCAALAHLRHEVEDVHPVELAWNLLAGPEGVAAQFTKTDAGTRVDLSCTPACRIAGTYRIELQARDSLGATSTKAFDLEVGNTPPVLTAHDGRGLPHQAIEEAALFRAARAEGAVLVWRDPDGDPPDPATVRWLSPSEAVAFADPASLNTALTATGTIEELASIEATVIAADINGAESADTKPLPIANAPPSITWGGDRREGHEFVSRSGGMSTWRKAIDFASLEARDPEGGPVSISFALDPTDADAAALGVSLVHGADGWSLEGSGPDFVGRSYGVVATAVDAWGATSSSAGSVLVSNRPPTIDVAPQSEVFPIERGCELQQCCVRSPSGSCVGPLYSARVATMYGPIGNPGPARIGRTFISSDPDGDPLEASVERTANYGSSPRLVVGGSAVFFPASVPCDDPAGLQSRCLLTLEMRGFTGTEPLTCELPGGTNLGAFAAFEVRVTDGLGGLSLPAAFDVRITDDPYDPSCP